MQNLPKQLKASNSLKHSKHAQFCRFELSCSAARHISIGRVPFKIRYFVLNCPMIRSTSILKDAIFLVPWTSTGFSCFLPRAEAGSANLAQKNQRSLNC